MPSVVFRRPRDLLKILLPFHVLPDGVAVPLAVTRFLRSKSHYNNLCIFRTYWTLNKQQMAAIILQLVWLSHGAPHWWQCAIISSDIRSPIRSSKTKFLPIKRTGKPCSRALRAYSIIPPSICQTLLNPLCFIQALAFSQRMPPVQYMTIFYLYVPASSQLLLAAAHGRYLPVFPARFQSAPLHTHSGYACR